MKHTIITLCTLFALTACESQEAGLANADRWFHAGQPVEITIGNYPAWGAGESPETGTRTTPDPDNPLKTNWEKGDKIWIAMWDGGASFNLIATAPATYNGATWDTDLRWPVGMIDNAYFYAYYLGAHKLGDSGFWDTDILLANAGYVFPGNTVSLRNFTHRTNRITITGQSLAGLYLSGGGFLMHGVGADYRETWQLLTDEYLPLSGTSTTVYLALNGSNTRQLYKDDGSGGHTLISDLTFSSNVDAGYSYTLDIDALGGINPDEMNKAQERARFLAWADKYRAYTYEDFTLRTDIDLSGVAWVPFDFENNTFDGGGHTISGLMVNDGGGDAGLFGRLDNATVKNLHVAGSVTGSGRGTGGIAGYVTGSTLENVSFAGTVSGSVYVGGIAGEVNNSYLFACQYLGDSSLDIVRNNWDSPVIGCYNKQSPGTVEAMNDEIRGYNATAVGKRCEWHWETGGNDQPVVKEGAP